MQVKPTAFQLVKPLLSFEEVQQALIAKVVPSVVHYLRETLARELFDT